MRAVAAILLLLALAGCAAPIVPPPAAPRLEILQEQQGWVQVAVTGIPSDGCSILWGDADSSYGRTEIVPWEEVYSHFYQAVDGERSGEQIPTEYQISVKNEEGQIVAQESVLITASVCHLQLTRLEGREVTVEYWGRFGVQYSISWGDRFAYHVWISTQSSGGIATHTYDVPGTYALGMEEIWAPRQVFFKITVE